MIPLPLTHLEFIEQGRPQILEHIRSRVARHIAVGRPMVADEVVDKEVSEFMTAEVIREIEINLRRRGVDPSKLTREQVIDAAPSEFKRSMLLTLNYSYNLFFNFMMMGEQVFFADAKAVDLAANAKGPRLCKDLRVPFKSCMLMMDDNLAREYLYADPDAEAPRSGPVTVYLTEHAKDYGRKLTIVAVHQVDSETIGILIERSLALRDGATVTEALATRWPDRSPDPLNAGFADDSQFIEGPGEVFIRLVCNLVYMADATIEPSVGKGASRFPFRRI